MTEVRVSAGLLLDPNGRVLLVRKKGTTAFMQPGGKPDLGESPAQALAREIAEEVGLRIPVHRMRPLGTFRAPAANEPGHEVIADALAVTLSTQESEQASAQAEIAEMTWIEPQAHRDIPLAPLTERYLLPLLRSN